MKNIVSVAEFTQRVSPRHPALPLGENGQIDEERVAIALQDATGIICARLLWLCGEDGQLLEPVNPQFEPSLKALCSDIALHRISETATQSEQDVARYRDMMKLLDTIDREYKGGLSGPGLQVSSVVVTPDNNEGIPDGRFFKKGRVF